ncbi:hypothetical protein PQX77_002783 [Marasmius sp. AFHP31]|nr:hypothetical protein PQX77_002783 [Marasmius sp. AFHP31]
MWDEQDQEYWEKRAQDAIDVDQNQEDLPALLNVILDTLAKSNRVGPMHAFVVVATQDSKGLVTTKMTEVGGSEHGFVKTWKTGKGFKECEEDAVAAFRVPFNDWAKTVLPYQQSKADSEGSVIDANQFSKSADGHWLFPSVNTRETKPEELSQYVKFFFEMVFKDQHHLDLPWDEIEASPERFYDRQMYEVQVFNPAAKGVRTGRIIDLAEDLHNLKTPFRFHSVLQAGRGNDSVPDKPADSTKTLEPEEFGQSSQQWDQDRTPLGVVTPTHTPVAVEQDVMKGRSGDGLGPDEASGTNINEPDANSDDKRTATSRDKPEESTKPTKPGKKGNKGGKKATNTKSSINEPDTVQSAGPVKTNKRKRTMNNEEHVAMTAGPSTHPEKKRRTKTRGEEAQQMPAPDGAKNFFYRLEPKGAKGSVEKIEVLPSRLRTRKPATGGV